MIWPIAVYEYFIIRERERKRKLPEELGQVEVSG